MRFLTGVASGYLGAANKEMDSNRKERDEWRKILFRHYTENVVPTYQKMKLTEMERANKAEQYGKLYGNPDLGNLVGNGIDPKTISQLYNISGGPAGGQTSGLGGAPAAVGGDDDDDLEGGTGSVMGQYDPNPNPELKMLQERLRSGVRSGSGLAGPDDFGQSKTPQSTGLGAPPREQNMWNKMLGTPDRGQIAEGVTKDLGSLYGIDPAELRGMAGKTLNPSLNRLPVNAANLPKMKDPGIERRYANLLRFAGNASDPGKFTEAVEKYRTTGDEKYAKEAMTLVLSPEDKAKLKEKYRKDTSGATRGDAQNRWNLINGPLIQGAKIEQQRAYDAAITAGKSPAEAMKAGVDAYSMHISKLKAKSQFENEIYTGLGGGAPGTGATDKD